MTELKRVCVGLVLGLGLMGVWTDCGSAQTPTEKLGRGLANTWLGWLEVPNQIVNTYRENTGKTIPTRNEATVKAIFVGSVKGVREAFKRTGHGLWDTLTFMSPGPRKQNYRSRIKPEFITENYNY